jgi:hypothetical protein
MSSLGEIIRTFETRKNVAKAKIDTGYDIERQKLVYDIYSEALVDLKRIRR